MFLADPDLAADEPALLATVSAAKAAGSVTLLHCEDGAMLRQAGEKLIAEGRGAVANFPDARPVAAEVAAVDRAISIARRTGAPVYIVHLSSAAALDRCRRARAAGLPVYVETRPLYLHLTRERFAGPDAAKYTGAPPLREACDRDALWAGLAAGDDVALWDPRYRRTIDGACMQSLSGYSVYDGWQVQGWPKFVIRRGQLVLAHGQITARPGDGEWLRRATTTQALPGRPMRPL